VAPAARLEVVFLDVGGVLYQDAVYARALLLALRELGADVGERDFNEEYEACRLAQNGSFRERLAARFLGPDASVPEVERRASAHWHYPPDSLEPDVLPCLENLSAAGYRLGVIANQPSEVREAMRRDGIEGFFDIWGVSEDLGIDKPDPRIFAHALEAAGVEPTRAAMVGDRLDYDMRPARQAGMLAVWMLRGEAPAYPTPEQLAEADETVRSLAELPAALERLSRSK
jgi:HAD superfamily hydrolase (TIGR01509 family)